MELGGYYHVHKGPALVSIQSYINPVDTLSSYFLQMYFMELESYYHVHKGPALVSIQSYINPVDTLSSYFLQMYFNIILQSMLISSKWSFTLCVPTKVLCVFIFRMCTTCPTHLILLDLITQTIFYREYKAYFNNPFCYVFVLLSPH